MVLPSTFPEIAALDLFKSVIELGSLSKAAARHHITQPSASSRIRTLEAQIGLQLLERSSTGSRLTADGQIVMNWVASVLDSADEMAAGVAALRAEATGLLRLASSYTIAEYLLPPWLERFLNGRDHDSVTLDVSNSGEVLDRVASRTVDLGFIESPLPTPTLNEQVVAHDDVITVVAARHPWARTASVSLDELAATPMVLREQGSGTRDALEIELTSRGHESPRSVLDLGSISAVRLAVMNGSSPTVISRIAVEADLAAGTLVHVEVRGLQIERSLRAVWPMNVELPRLGRELLAELPDLG